MNLKAPEGLPWPSVRIIIQGTHRNAHTFRFPSRRVAGNTVWNPGQRDAWYGLKRGKMGSQVPSSRMEMKVLQHLSLQDSAKNGPALRTLHNGEQNRLRVLNRQSVLREGLYVGESRRRRGFRGCMCEVKQLGFLGISRESDGFDRSPNFQLCSCAVRINPDIGRQTPALASDCPRLIVGLNVCLPLLDEAPGLDVRLTLPIRPAVGFVIDRFGIQARGPRPSIFKLGFPGQTTGVPNSAVCSDSRGGVRVRVIPRLRDVPYSSNPPFRLHDHGRTPDGTERSQASELSLKPSLVERNTPSGVTLYKRVHDIFHDSRKNTPGLAHSPQSAVPLLFGKDNLPVGILGGGLNTDIRADRALLGMHVEGPSQKRFGRPGDYINEWLADAPQFSRPRLHTTHNADSASSLDIREEREKKEVVTGHTTWRGTTIRNTAQEYRVPGTYWISKNLTCQT
ncbi:hypothetical protein BDM02DRAFT_3126573 [Thelephora ganbajun]|uniref:Uncharacterized protein n=1 Tax=Thelephora ganbajun TaxID=370292 RepID=A0ACB6ZRI1_THEGA|nr:hypothetical protein BDM02DRAFT_3126573 [Thelephora ganbajun]